MTAVTTAPELWQWEAYNADGRRKRGGEVDPRRVWWATDAQEVADFGLAQILVRTHQQFARLAGWSVKAWREGDESEPAWAYVDDWLRTLQQGALDQLRKASRS